MPRRTRRAVLSSVAGLALLAGCGSRPTAQPADGQSTQSTEAPPPSSGLTVVSGDSVSFSGDVSLSGSDLVGWVVDGSFTRALDLSASVTDGPAATVYVTDERLQDAVVPESTVASFETNGSVEGLELTDGTGTILLEAEEPTTVSVSFDAESI
ncbi:MAG: hypothetical protein ABEJ90_00240 [Halobacterium sp.]